MSDQLVLTPEMYDCWKFMVAALEIAARESQEAWTVQTVSSDWEFGPYLQVCYNDDFTEIQAEITSNRYLEPPMPGFDVHRMMELGWTAPQGGKLPNWYIHLPHTEDSCAHIARVWVRTLLDCYDMKPEWEFGPAPLAPSVVKPWVDFMVKGLGVSTFSLVDGLGRNRSEIAESLRTEREAREFDGRTAKQHADLMWKAFSVLGRGEKLGLQGLDLARLASTMYQQDVVTVIQDILINGLNELPNLWDWNRLARLGIYPSVDESD